MTTQPLIISDFDKAIADSPHKGFGHMSRVNIESFPGAVTAGKDVSSLFTPSLATTFTADAGTDVCTTTVTTIPQTGIAVLLTTTNTLPAGLSTGTVYFLIRVSTSTFKLATTIANANVPTPINITDAGTGVHTVTVIDPGQVNNIVKDPRTSEKFYQDDNNRVWYGTAAPLLLLNGNTLTLGAGNGLVLSAFSSTTATYLFAFRNAKIDVIDVFGTTQLETPSWSNDWQSLNTAQGTENRHHAIVAQDDIIYFTDDRYVGSLKENSGQTFAPGTGATFTFNNQVLDLPSREVAEHIEELGKNLLTAGSKFNKIYPWDRTSASFNLPLFVPEQSVKRLKNMGDIVYILAGTKGNIYATQGSFVWHFKKIPEQVTNNAGTLTASPVTWGAMEALNGKLLVGAGTTTSGNSGVYLIQPDGRVILDQIPSASSTNVTAFEVSNDFYILGYADGADIITNDRYSALESYIESALYRVATKTEKATYSVLEVLLAKPASAGNVQIDYRNNTSGGWTNIDTFVADGVAVTFKNDAIGLIDIENIQVRAKLDDDVELLEIRLLP